VNNTHVLIAGEGGQGVQTIAEILARAAFLEGKHSTYIPNFGVEQRGGVSIAFAQISDKEIVFPKFDKADIMIILCHRAIKRAERYFGKKTLYIYDSILLKHKGIGIKATTLAKSLSPKVFNMIILGFLSTKLPIKKQSVIRGMEEVLGKKFRKNPQIRELNLKALDIGSKL